VDASVLVAMYVCSFGSIYISIRVGKAEVKSRRYQEPVAFMCPVSQPAEYFLRKWQIFLLGDGK